MDSDLLNQKLKGSETSFEMRTKLEESRSLLTVPNYNGHAVTNPRIQVSHRLQTAPENDNQLQEEIQNKEKLIKRLETRVGELDNQQKQYATFSSKHDPLQNASFLQQSIKLQQAKEQGETLIKRLKHECRMLSQLDHENFNGDHKNTNPENGLEEVESPTFIQRENIVEDFNFSPIKKKSASVHADLSSTAEKSVNYLSTSYVLNPPNGSISGSAKEAIVANVVSTNGHRYKRITSSSSSGSAKGVQSGLERTNNGARVSPENEGNQSRDKVDGGGSRAKIEIRGSAAGKVESRADLDQRRALATVEAKDETERDTLNESDHTTNNISSESATSISTLSACTTIAAAVVDSAKNRETRSSNSTGKNQATPRISSSQSLDAFDNNITAAVHGLNNARTKNNSEANQEISAEFIEDNRNAVKEKRQNGHKKELSFGTLVTSKDVQTGLKSDYRLSSTQDNLPGREIKPTRKISEKSNQLSSPNTLEGAPKRLHFNEPDPTLALPVSGVRQSLAHSDLLEELNLLRENNKAMQTVIDQLTEEIKLRDRTITDLETQIQQLSSIITTKQQHPQTSGSQLGLGFATGDNASITSDLSHMTSLTSSTIPVQPATLYQCTRCEEIFKSIVQFQVHITQCLEQSVFDKNSSKVRRSRSAATSRERSRSGQLFLPKSQESINGSRLQSQESILTATSGTTAHTESANTFNKEKEMLPAGNPASSRSHSTSVLYHENAGRHIRETSMDAVDSSSASRHAKLTSTENVGKNSNKATTNLELKKLPSQPILSYRSSPKYDELWPSESSGQLAQNDSSMRDTFGYRNFEETASSLRLNASFSQQRPPVYPNSKNATGKKLQKSSSDAVYIPKELRPLRPKNPAPASEDPQRPNSIVGDTLRSQRRSPQSAAPSHVPPRGATLAAYHNTTSPNISPAPSLERRSPVNQNPTSNPGNGHQPNGRSRPLGPPPPLPPKRGEDSRQKAQDAVNKPRSARSRVKDAVKSPFSSIRRRMKSMSSLERIPRNKDIERERRKEEESKLNNFENPWDISNGPVPPFYPNSSFPSNQSYPNGAPMSKFSPPQRAASFYGSMRPQSGGGNYSNPAMYRPLPPSPNTRFYNHSYKYSSNESAARAFLHGTDV